jgi:hypothetical protein
MRPGQVWQADTSEPDAIIGRPRDFLLRRRRPRIIKGHNIGDRFLSTHLTKSRSLAGLQCLRRLWLLVHEPAPYEEPAPSHRTLVRLVPCPND